MVESDSSPDLTIRAEFTILSAASKLTPARTSRSMIPEAMAPSTAARPPVPMPSQIIAIWRPLPSGKHFQLSPQNLPLPQTCCAHPVLAR